MGEAVDTIPSILNKCLFVSPDKRTNKRTSRKQYAPHFFKVGGIKTTAACFFSALQKKVLINSMYFANYF